MKQWGSVRYCKKENKCNFYEIDRIIIKAIVRTEIQCSSQLGIEGLWKLRYELFVNKFGLSAQTEKTMSTDILDHHTAMIQTMLLKPKWNILTFNYQHLSDLEFYSKETTPQ